MRLRTGVLGACVWLAQPCAAAWAVAALAATHEGCCPCRLRGTRPRARARPCECLCTGVAVCGSLCNAHLACLGRAGCDWEQRGWPPGLRRGGRGAEGQGPGGRVWQKQRYSDWAFKGRRTGLASCKFRGAMSWGGPCPGVDHVLGWTNEGCSRRVCDLLHDLALSACATNPFGIIESIAAFSNALELLLSTTTVVLPGLLRLPSCLAACAVRHPPVRISLTRVESRKSAWWCSKSPAARSQPHRRLCYDQVACAQFTRRVASIGRRTRTWICHNTGRLSTAA